MIKDLAKKISAPERFFDEVISEIKFIRGEFRAGLKILKNTAEFKIILAATETEKIFVKMIAPRKKICSAFGTRIQSEKKTQLVFTALEVFDFGEEVGDKNKIYKLSPPIVPPLLILETLLKIEKFSSCEILKLRFKHFITAGEPLTLQSISEKNFELQSAGERKVLISTE